MQPLRSVDPAGRPVFATARRLWLLRRTLAYLAAAGAGMVFGALALIFLMAGDIYDYQDTVDGVHLPKIDAIVVLAGGRGRIAAAGDIWYRYWELAHPPARLGGHDPLPPATPILYLSGMGHQAGWNVVAHQLRRGVLDVIRPEDVIIERESTNTPENARWFSRSAIERGWDGILMITSPYHMKRSRFIFDRVLNAYDTPVRIETLSVFQEPFEPGEWRTSFYGIRVTMLEYIKWIYYKLFWRPN